LVSDEILDFVRALEPASHSIFFYECPEEKHETLFTFLQDGFEKGRGAIYITGQETPAQIRESMEKFGICAKTLEKEGTLKIINYDQCYIIDGKVDPPKIFAFGRKLFTEAMEKGLKGLNGCGEAACFFQHGKERDLVQYELECGRKFRLDVTALCAYDVNHVKSLKVNYFLNLIKAHGFTIAPSFASEITFETFYPIIVQEKLEATLGTSAAQAILWHLEKQHSIKREKIGENPEALTESLESLFGIGAELLEEAIREGIFSRIGLQKTSHPQTDWFTHKLTS